MKIISGCTVIATGAIGGGTAVIGMRSAIQGSETHVRHEPHYHELREQPMPLYESVGMLIGPGLGLAAWKAGERLQQAWERFSFYR